MRITTVLRGLMSLGKDDVVGKLLCGKERSGRYPEDSKVMLVYFGCFCSMGVSEDMDL